MTSLKMWYLLFLAVFLFLHIVPTEAEVVTDVSKCEGFLLEEKLPQLPGILDGGIIQDQKHLKYICQTYKNVKRFLTLYDTNNKIPVFSAYSYRGDDKSGRPEIPWNIEPQLDNINADKNMVNGDKTTTSSNQSVNDDYKDNNTVYNRGHLYPSSYGLKEDDKKSTFTLTNVVPQAITFNGGSWNKMEQCIKCVMDKHCINSNKKIEGFVVTGAKPSNNLKLNKRVNIPSMLWSAFCCFNSKDKEWLASAHWGDNVKDEPTTKHMNTENLAKLYEKLGGAKVFPDTKCPLDTTATKFYKDTESACNCPK